MQKEKTHTCDSLAIGEHNKKKHGKIENYSKIRKQCKCPETATRVVLKKDVLKNFTIFIGKHLRWGFFLVKLFQHRCFPVNIAKFLRTLILKNICERLLLNFVSSSNAS